MSLETILNSVGGLSAAVIGDLCLDAYFFMNREGGEVSVETGLQTRSVREFRFGLGGAANVALNLKRLGLGSVDLYGLVGDDDYAQIFRYLLGKDGLGAQGVIAQGKDWMTQVYHKIYLDGEEEPRLDVGNFNVPQQEALDRLLSVLESKLATYDLVIVNEQVPAGFHNEYFQGRLSALMAAGTGPLWIGDCRRLNDTYPGLIHKLNRREALSVCSLSEMEGEIQDEELVAQLYRRWKKPVVMTRDKDGAIAYDGSSRYEVLGLHMVNRIDTVGAGDAFLSGLSAALAAGADLAEALRLGNLSAGVSIQKLYQTGQPSPAEILALGRAPDYRYNPNLAASPERAKFLDHTEIEIIAKPDISTPEIAIFDHDGTISTLRLGWEGIMERMMVNCVVGEAGPCLSTAQLDRVRQAVRELIARTTGVQTLVQMRVLTKLIADFGYVKADSILSAAEYKAIYNEELLKMVEERVDRMRRGKLDVQDLTIKGAVSFLERLNKAGITLFLASGTDQEDVVREAELLGYAGLFNGGIRGSVGDIDRDPKRVVMEELLGTSGGVRGRRVRCAVFGDGPVELREAKRAGAAAIGLCSDEVRRFGTNPKKRERLVLAGADLIVPDFSWSGELISFLGWRV